MSKFQPNRTLTFALTACGNARIRQFYKRGRRTSVSDELRSGAPKMATTEDKKDKNPRFRIGRPSI